MSTADNAPSAGESRLERAGVRFLQSLARERKPVSQDALHVLNAEERRALVTIERNAIARAALAGALSGLVCAIPAIVLSPVQSAAPVEAHAKYWAIVVGVTIVASVLEIAFLYWDGLRSVQKLAHAAGMDLAAPELEGDKTSALWALARAALEAPNPPDAVPGVDPLREASRARVFAASLLYKLKVTISGFLVKALVRRALGRAATRTVLELVAVPVTALWDGLVCWLIVREARLRVLGPSAAVEFTSIILGDAERRSPACRATCARAVGAAAVRSEDLHPNLVALLREVRRVTALADGDAQQPVEAIDDSARFLSDLEGLSKDEQAVALRVLATASIIDGRLAREEKRLLHEAFDRAGRALDLAVIEALRRAFVSGDAIPPAKLEAIR
ncbi:MAG: hypothetical protein JNK05_21205 [Myxococcales bacterium]|nr:hypothetical protein [Myxococcales bacterium]